jgi:6-pyruvoyltetrahydropterin/6-carboxytetrahydropterin synthase
MDVTIRGELDPRLGRLMSVEQLDAFVHRTVVGALAHRNLNVEVPEFATLVPTTENLARVAAAGSPPHGRWPSRAARRCRKR